MFFPKIESFFTVIIKMLLRDQSNISHAVSKLEFLFKKLQLVTFWMLNHCLYGPKWTGNIFFLKILLTGFRTSNLTSFNTRFWSSQSDNGKRYLQKLDLLSSPWLFVEVHFTCESKLNNDYLEKHLLYRESLWMSQSQLFEIFDIDFSGFYQSRFSHQQKTLTLTHTVTEIRGHCNEWGKGWGLGSWLLSKKVRSFRRDLNIFKNRDFLTHTASATC